MGLEENFQTNAVILTGLDAMTVEQKNQIDKFDEFVNPYQKVLEANLNSVFLDEGEKSRIMNEFKTNHANIIKNILDDTFDEETAQDSIVDKLNETVKEAKGLIKNNPKYQEITQDVDDLEEDELEDNDD